LNHHNKSKEELIQELQQLKQAHDSLLIAYNEGVNERKSAQEALNESQSKYHLLAFNTAEVIWTLDQDYKFTFISPAIKQLRGVSPEEAICEAIETTMPPHSQKLIFTTLSKCRENERAKNYTPLRIEFEQYHQEGHLIWVEVFIRALLNEQGEMLGYVGNSRDITHRKKAEKAMEEVVKRFETLVAKVPVGLFILKHQTNGHIGFEYVSDRWCEIHQAKREEVMADISKANQLIHKDDLNGFLSINTEAIRDRKRFVWEGRMAAIGDEQRWFHIESIPISYKDGYDQWYGVAQDITKRKQAENALRESERRLRELNAQKDKFFSIIAHDLMSPFNGILGFSQLLITQINENDYEGIHEYAEMIEQSSKQTVDLLTNLLEWSRSQTGRMEFNPTNFELVELITEHQQLFDFIAGQKSISICTDLPHKMMVFADKQMTSAVLRNLISNAIKFTRPGGQVTLSATKSEDEIGISVSDNGIGIPSERLEKLFRIDESESTPGTKDETGTGLGLILCKEFIEKHGGKIWVDSEPGKGSTFRFTLM
jgi:PAS domain S-box-containing protein